MTHKASHAMHLDQLKTRRGFSLVELAIALVIIGLLIAGVMTGRHLIRAGEERSVISDIEKFMAATHTFEEKYSFLPGDMLNATEYWGAAGPYGACAGIVSGTTATCDGNGSGTVGSYGDEDARYWQHLANAGLIPGSYSGTYNADNTYVVGWTVPKSKLGESIGYSFNHLGLFSGDANLIDHQYDHVYFLAGESFGWSVGGAVILPTEAYNIDMKMDDGLPGSGRVMGPRGDSTGQPDCTEGADPNNPVYNVAYGLPACWIIFKYGL